MHQEEKSIRHIRFILSTCPNLHHVGFFVLFYCLFVFNYFWKNQCVKNFPSLETKDIRKQTMLSVLFVDYTKNYSPLLKYKLFICMKSKWVLKPMSQWLFTITSWQLLCSQCFLNFCGCGHGCSCSNTSTELWSLFILHVQNLSSNISSKRLQ